ncbi:regulatory protein RecX [uncultured Amnibacterium sp.]|uniref:regulatory protein RecX n=1 Tax=uncultured Amnibacterium sp. TaxID=1631851 RepID=UPI0035C97BE2
MGELRYFPGSEPRSAPPGDGHGPSFGAVGSPRQTGAGGPTHEETTPEDTALDGAGLDATGPGWAVPGLDLGGPRSIDDDPAASHPSRGSRRAEHVSMSAISTRDVSEAELRTRLAARGLDQADIDAELQRVTAVGLVDDAALAARLVQTLRERKGLGDAAIRPALRARRIPQAMIDAVLLQHADDESTVQDRLQDVADDRARRLVSLQPEVAERRLAAFLARKGYGGSTVRAAARLALERARGSV